jgi:hypothetical protein
MVDRLLVNDLRIELKYNFNDIEFEEINNIMLNNYYINK